MNLFDPSDFTKAGGKKIYQSGLKKADIVTKKFGKGEKALSETLLKNRVTGSAETIADEATALADRLAQRQKAILTEATARGARVDAEKLLAPIKGSAENIAKGKNVSSVRGAAASFANELDDIARMGGERQAQELVENVASPILDSAGAPIMSQKKTVIPAQAAFTPVEASNIKTQIYLDIDGGQVMQTLLHEVVHATVSEYGLRHHEDWCAKVEEVVAEILSKVLVANFQIRPQP